MQIQVKLMIFCKDNKYLCAFVFSKFQKVGKFAASIERSKTKNASASGGFAH